MISHRILKVLRNNLAFLALLAFYAFYVWFGLWALRISQASVDSGTYYYLDCSAHQSGNGSQKSPWNSLAVADVFTFHPGDHLFLKRGAACNGALAPQGSGTPNAPIVIDAYGTGPQPVINGGTSEAAVKLFDQQYWEINNLEITGGTLYGVFVSGNTPNSTINHIYLRNLNIHGATFISTKRADSGEVFFSAKAPGQVLNDVLIDGVNAHDTHASEGIFVSAGGGWIEGNGKFQPHGNNITVQNSTAHDVYGDGIVISELYNGLLQMNVVYNTGLCPNCTGSTPVGLWEWYCHICVVQFNESYANQSWGVDGGDFDIDYFNDNNVVQYNYGHDSAGYCVAFFGAGGRATVDNIFRFNVCSNNGRRSDLSKQGDVYVHTWDNGSLNGVQIYNNTFYWNPVVNAPALSVSDAIFSGSDPLFFKNNIIYSTVPDLIQTASPLALDHNIYWTTAASSPNWKVDATTCTTLSAYQAATKQDVHSFFVDPKLSRPDYHEVGKPTSAFHLLPGSPAVGAGVDVCPGINGCSMGSRDFWGNPFSAGRAFNIGAYQGP